MKRTWIAVALAVVASAAFAQESAVIDVQITNLDVVVTDAKGKRVTGLTKDDFEVLENGQKQEITNLSEASRTTSTSTETIQPAPRRILLIVDNGTIALSARRKVFDATRKALGKLMIGPSDRVAIATISHSVEQRLDWTSNTDEVLRTLTEVEMDAILPNPDLLAFERSLDSILDEADTAAASITGTVMNTGAPEGAFADDESSQSMMGTRQRPQVDFQQILAYARNYASSATTDTRSTLSALGSAIASFAAVPGGRKIMIIAGGGLPINAGEAVMQKVENLREELDRNGHLGVKGARSASTLTQISRYDVTSQVDGVATVAKLKGVAIYAVNPEFGDRLSSSARSSRGADMNAEFATMKGMLDGYQRLAIATGGAAMIGRPADQVLTEIINDLDSYYSIGYRAAGPLDPKSRIEVKVKKGLSARSTIASGAVSRDWEVADQVLANHIAEPDNPLGVSVAMEPAITEGGKKTIPMKIMIPVDSLKLVQSNGEYAAAFAVFISLGDAAGNGSDPVRQQQSFRWPENSLDQVKGKTIGFSVNVEVSGDRDRDRVSVGVLDQNSGEAGFTRLMLE